MSEAEDYQPTEEENAAENEGDNQDTNLNSSEPFDDTKEEEGEINEDEINVVQITDGGGNPEDQIDNNTNQSGLDDDRLEEEEDIEKRAEENLGEEAEDQEVNENDFEEINDGDAQFDNAPEEQLDEFQSGEVTEVHNDLDNDDELIDQAQTDEEANEEQNNLDQDEYTELNKESTEMVDNYQNIDENIEGNTFEDHDELYNETMEEHIDGEKTPELGGENDDYLEAEEEDEEKKEFDNNFDDTNLQALREFSEAFANQILIAAQNEEQRARERAELNYSESEKEDVENKGIQSTPTIDIQAEDYNTDQQIEISQEAEDQRTEADNDPSTTSLYEKDDKELPDMNKNANSLGNWGTNSPNNFPSPERSYSSIEGQMSTSALNIVWSFGLNRNVPVLNLSDGVRQAIMYSCAHVGIMYDYKNNKQHILQAHLNPITCSAVSQDKRWLVTGDVGPDAMVNIWDTYTGTPIQTMFDPNPKGGVVAVALTPDSRYLATLSALPIQTLAIWDWTVDGDVPICSADLKPEYGLQNFIAFDSTDVHHLVTNSESQVLFYNWEDSLIKYYAPPLSDSDFNKPVGRYSQSMFQIGIARALTATSIGNLVVWDNNRPLSMMYLKPEIDVWTGLPIMDVNQSADKKPLKIIKVHDKGINVLTNTDNYIVIGDTAGHIKFYDQCLRLIYWYQEFHSGPCTSISFAYMPDFVTVATEGSKYPSDATKQAKPFVIRDFIVGTSIAIYCSINTDGSKIKVIHREHDAAVHALAAHPKLPILAIGSYSGLLKLWNYRTKEVVASKIFEKCHIQCCAFDPKGFYIALGLTNGIVHLVDAVALLEQLKEPFRYAKDTITHITFSHNSQYLATADAGFTITVYKRQRKEGRSPYIWHGRYRSHYKPIKDLLFEIHLDTNQPKLLSLGEDRMLIEYDLNIHGKANKLMPIAFDRIEQAAIPQCMTKYPPITKENFFLTANDQYKLKCYNSTTKMCRKTVLGPTYGSPIRKMMVVPTDKDESRNRFLAYITDDKVGLHFLPATGNPHLAMALIAHPSGVSNLTCSFDGAYLFTAGGPDFAVHMWEINIAALSAQAKLGGEDLVPFYGLLEGGRDGELFAELEELFYYAQLRHQGINSLETRQISNRVPLTEVPYIMRAMGFYPSEQEIEDMLNEIKYDEYVNLGHYQEDIDLGGFIKLYVNHRPAFGLSAEKLLWAFETLAENVEPDKGGVIERGDFLNLLTNKGEHMTEEELTEHLTTLLGFNREGGSCEEEPLESDAAGAFIADTLPFDINAEILINEILGFSMTVDPPAKVDTKDVVKF
ncbi:cilia- and flagella-associated protein 251-like isoform X2 [Biomphalaria glabrata]|uniref:Cilia- and flagella-associated protein 251 n=1 Tax=Biomphalaria glabrata TaxID=6526 RepID=A0A9W2YER3_BIOGL|nr:cilia- and flagella-associated protein 251-like isoform X2 [Biomphalaria glabrata]